MKYSARMMDGLKRWGLIAGLVTACGALFGAHMTIPARVETNERAIEKLKADREKDRELLIKIEAALEYLRKNQ